MPKLPDNFVTAPSFDNPLRSTATKDALAVRKLDLRVDSATWEVLSAASKREGVSPEVLAQRALDRWLSESYGPGAPAPSLRAQLIGRLQERLVPRSWVQRLLTVREILRERRA